MSMMFSQNVGITGKISRRPLPMLGVVSGPLYITSRAAPAPAAPVQQQRAAVAPTSRSAPAPAPRSVKQLFNMGNIMSNPGTPCKACGS